ncbi:MAG: ABC transporter permease subunit [Chloroflexi bacterium]|nr:ABC transporter permease subunit [Chloroflexota bacterium]
MTGTIFVETLRRNWRQILYWGISLALLGWMIAAIVQDVDILKQYEQIAKNFPPALLQLFGAEDAATLTTPEGFITYGFFGYSLLILAVYAVIAGLGVTANEEDAGIMDIVLSLPVPRWRVVLEKLAAYMLIMVAIIAVSFLGLLIGAQMSPVMREVNLMRLVEGTLNMIPSSLLMIAITTFAAAIVRRKNTATGIAAAVIVGSYFVDFLGKSASQSALGGVRAVSFFSYYDPQAVLVNGLNVGHVALLLAITGLLVAGTVWAFQRRDVGV